MIASMDTTKIRTGLLQLQHDASANPFDFDAAYQSIQEWVSIIRQEASFQPLKEGVAIIKKPLALLGLENDVEELVEAIQLHDLNRTRQACAAALASVDQIH
jgi:hypothetical protein